VSAKCHVMLSLSDFEQPESADALLTAIAAEELVRLRKVGAIALFWSGLPYADLGRSPHKTLGRPTGRVKAFCVPSCVPNAQDSGGATVSLCGNGTPELGRPPRSRTQPRRATWSFGWKGSRRTSLDRCDRRVWPDARGHRAGSPLISAIRSWEPTEGAGWLVTSFSTASSPGRLPILLPRQENEVLETPWAPNMGTHHRPFRRASTGRHFSVRLGADSD
jgi:hypothetical protein